MVLTLAILCAIDILRISPVISFCKLYLPMNSVKVKFIQNKNFLQQTGHGTADRLKHNRIQVMVPDPGENQVKIAFSETLVLSEPS